MTRLELHASRPRDEREQLRSAMTAGEQATDQLVELEGLHEELLELSQDALAEARSRFEVASDRLATFDAESERLLAETGGRVRSLDARIRHARAGDCASGARLASCDIPQLEVELSVARHADSQRMAERLSGRDWIARECRAARMSMLTAGQARLALSAPYVPALREIQQAGLRAAERDRELAAAAVRAGEVRAAQASVIRLVTPRSPVAAGHPGEPDASGESVQHDRNGGSPRC